MEARNYSCTSIHPLRYRTTLNWMMDDGWSGLFFGRLISPPTVHLLTHSLVVCLSICHCLWTLSASIDR
jgi:hypothetical protein